MPSLPPPHPTLFPEVLENNICQLGESMCHSRFSVTSANLNTMCSCKFSSPRGSLVPNELPPKRYTLSSGEQPSWTVKVSNSPLPEPQRAVQAQLAYGTLGSHRSYDGQARESLASPVLPVPSGHVGKLRPSELSLTWGHMAPSRGNSAPLPHALWRAAYLAA